MKAVVTQGIRVVGNDGKAYRDGQSLDVPDSVAADWIAWGWVSVKGLDSLPDARGLSSGQLPHIEPGSSGDAGTELPDSPDESESPKPTAKVPRVKAKVRRDPRRKSMGDNDGD